MRNLKRALSFALAAIMLIGLMVVGAGAVAAKDFTDADEIQNSEAVSTLVALNVIAGKEDGSYFDPTGTLTRAEMAKIITYVMNGGVEPVLNIKPTPTYSDIDNHWAEKYIEYCSSQGIIAGDGAGKFNPEGTLTASQAAKMLLVAMGYDANVFGFIGNSWEINVNKEANAAGLYDELSGLDPSQPVSRDNACQIAYNAIQGTMMKRTWNQDMQTGEITETYAPWIENNVRHTLLGEKFGAFVVYGQLTNVNKARLNIVIDHNYDSDSTGSATSFSKLTEDYSSLLGETVRVIYKESDKVLAVIPEDCNIVYNVNRADVEQDNAKVKFGGTSYSIEELQWGGGTPAVIDEDANEITYLYVNKDGVAMANSVTSATFAANRNSFNTVKFVDNDDDGVLEYAVEWEVAPGKVTYASDTEIIAGGTTYKLAENTVADGVVRDDYVAASYNVFNDNYDVVKLEMGTAAVSINNTAPVKYMFDDVWYYRGANVLTDNPQAGSTYDYWTCNGVIVDTKLNVEGTSLTNLVMVIRKDGTGIDDRAKVIYTDGTVKTLNVVPDDYSTADVNYGAITAGSLYTVTETSKGYSFKALNTNDKLGNHTYTAAGAVTDSDAHTDTAHITAVGGNSIADDAVVFVYTGNNGGEGKVLNGKQLKNLNASGTTGDIATTATGYFTNKVDGLTRVSVAAVTVAENGALPVGTATYDNFALVVSDAYTVVDSDYFTYEIWDGESMYRVKEQGTLTAGMREQFDVITYNSVGEDSVITDVVELTQTTTVTANTVGNLAIAPVYSTSNGKLWISNTADLELNNSTVYMYYDSSATKAADIGKADGSLIKADLATSANTNLLVPNVKYMGDGSDVIFVLVDVKNKIVDDEARNAFNMTASAIANFNGVTGASVTFSRATKVVNTETLTMTISTGATALPAGTLGLANAIFTETGTANYTFAGLAANKSVDISIVANNAAGSAISVGYSGVSSGDSAAQISNAVNNAVGPVTLSGDYNLTEALTINTGKTLNITGKLTVTSMADLANVNGTLTAGSIDATGVASITGANVGTLLGYTSDLEVGALTLSAGLDVAKGKTLTAASVTGNYALTAKAGTNDTTDKGATIVVTGAVADNVVAEAHSSVTVGSIGDYANSTSDATATVTVTGDITASTTLPAGMAGTTVFNGELTGSGALVLNAASKVKFTASVDMTKVTGSAGATIELAQTPSAVVTTDADYTFVNGTSGASTHVTAAGNVRTNVTYTLTALGSAGSGHGLTTATNVWYHNATT